MNVILHKNSDGTNAVTYIAQDVKLSEVQNELGGVEISAQINDVQMDFINAYDISGDTIQLNLEKARLIKLEKIREQRNQAFIGFDKRYEITQRDEADLTELKVERQKLKDAPQKAERFLDSCINIEEINSVSLASVL